jgi:hypothetical protein
MPSPSINGIMGRSGTFKVEFELTVIFDAFFGRLILLSIHTHFYFNENII